MKKVKLYCNGGSGFNIAADLIKNNVLATNPNVADVEICLIDTSESNYNKHKELFDKHNIKPVFIPGTNGAGTVRKDIVDRVVPHIPGIIYDNIPGDLNIVIHSAGGGSGSVVGPLVTKELLTNGYNTIVVLIGDTSNDTFAKNTSATIRTYEAFSREIEIPINCRYYQNHISSNASIDTINNAINSFVNDLRVLFSGNIHGVDDSDLKNLLNFYKVTRSKSTLTLFTTLGLKVGTIAEEFNNILDEILGRDRYNIVALANIVPYGDAHHQSVICEYRIEGSLEYSNDKEGKKELYYLLTDNYFYHVLEAINRDIAQYERKARERQTNTIKIGETSTAGMVF